MLDYRDPVWRTFDIQPILLPLVAVGEKHPSPKKPTMPPPQPPPSGDFERAVQWILDREGGFQNNPADPGNYYNGQLIGTKYGISAASWGGQYDIQNLTIDQAKAIYREHYWRASGADKLAWPLSLLVFDTAVLHGVGAATTWLKEVGPNPYQFAAKRLYVYVNSGNWQEFGNGWVRRTADLLRESAA